MRERRHAHLIARRGQIRGHGRQVEGPADGLCMKTKTGRIRESWPPRHRVRDREFFGDERLTAFVRPRRWTGGASTLNPTVEDIVVGSAGRDGAPRVFDGSFPVVRGPSSG